MSNIRINMMSESDISVQGHGVHTAYIELVEALGKQPGAEVIRGHVKDSVDCDIIHLHTFGPYAVRKLLQRGPKKVISAHVVPASMMGSIIGARYWMPLMRHYLRWYYNKADLVLAVSGNVAKALQTELSVPKDKIKTFYNTIDMGRYAFSDKDKVDARRGLNIKPEQFIVLGIGQVQPRKRLDVFISMAKQLPNVTFIWVGGIPFKHLGAEYQAMQKLIDSRPNNLLLPGIINHEDIKQYLAASDVFCLPAEQENHPMCVLEAAGASLPIILRDIAEYNDTFMYDAIRCDDNDFAGSVIKLSNDAQYYKQQQAKSKVIAERFDSSRAAQDLLDIYEHLLNSKIT